MSRNEKEYSNGLTGSRDCDFSTSCSLEQPSEVLADAVRPKALSRVQGYSEIEEIWLLDRGRSSRAYLSSLDEGLGYLSVSSTVASSNLKEADEFVKAAKTATSSLTKSATPQLSRNVDMFEPGKNCSMNRCISTRPKRITAAFVLSPSPRPSTNPAAQATIF